jgi:hypothetical protein
VLGVAVAVAAVLPAAGRWPRLASGPRDAPAPVLAALGCAVIL